MISKTLTTLTFLFTLITLNAQSIEEYYQNGDFKNLIKYSDKADELSKEECYYIGYAFFQLEDDINAIKMYDKAIEKGLDDDIIYLFKGLSLRYNQQFDKAIQNFKIAIERNPKGQKNYTELANSFYYQEQLDSALVYFYQARALDYELGDPYFKVPHIHHVQQNFTKALEEYRTSASMINKEDPSYLEIIGSIGLLEYTVTKDFTKAIEAYQELISIVPENYDLYPKLIKAYFANEQYDKGNELIQKMKIQYDNNKLSEDYQNYGSVAIDEFIWNEQRVNVFKYFKVPTETLDVMYKFYLITKDGKRVERTILTEKTIQLEENGPKHLLCETFKDGGHSTYPYGWATDDIDYADLKSTVIKVLDDSLQPTASSRPNFEKQEKKKKKKKKKKKN